MRARVQPRLLPQPNGVRPPTPKHQQQKPWSVDRVKKHDIFERDGDDLHCSVPISITTAALGGEIRVPTLAGEAAIDIPEGTQNDKQFRLRGKGIKGVRSHTHGDLMCHVVVETPVNLTDRQKELLRELEESSKDNSAKHNPRSKSWMDKVKEFFGD